MPGEHCFGSLQVCAVRVAKLDANGSPLTGSGNGLVTDALIDATIDPDVETGTSSRIKNACGNICATFKGCDTLLGVNLSMNLCELDAQLLSFLVGGDTILDLGGAGAGDVIGMELPGVSDACPNGVSLEMWSKAWDSDQQATPPFLGGTTAAYFHWVFPRTKWQIGSLNFEEDFMTVAVNGYGEANANITTNGPFDDWPTDVAARGGITNCGGFFLQGSIPTASCDAISVSSAAS